MLINNANQQAVSLTVLILMANIPVLISLDCTFTCSEASRDKKHYFLFIFKAWHRPIYPLWLPEWSGRLWNFSVPTPLCIVISSTVLAKPRGEKAEQGIRSLKIAPRHRGLERKRLAVLHHHSAGRFFLSVLLSHTLLMFLSAVQSGGCRDIVPLGQHFKELPESGLAWLPAHHRLTVFTRS